MRAWAGSLVLGLLLGGCNSKPDFSLGIMNETSSKLNLSISGNITEIPVGKHVRVDCPNVKGQTLTFYQNGNKLEEFTVGVTPTLIGSPEDKVLILMEDPQPKTHIWRADYTDLYSNGTFDPKSSGSPSAVEDVSLKKIYRFPFKTGEISYPEDPIPPSLEKDHRLFRLVRVPANLKARQVGATMRSLMTDNEGKQTR